MEYERHTHEPNIQLSSQTNGITARCSGAWLVSTITRLEAKLESIPTHNASCLVLDCSEIVALDTAGAWLLQRTVLEREQQGMSISLTGLRPEFEPLINLISTYPNHPPPLSKPSNFLSHIGRQAYCGLLKSSDMLAFIGETTIILLRTLTQPHRMRWRSLLHNIQQAGFDALPIVGLLSFLMGMVIAYQSADQLQRFGANIFVADLVGLSMLRELSPLLTAIIIAGRSGSAYAAQIGTMKVTEEIDALRTIGISPTERLVIPKFLALIIALPLLTVYADLTGLLGGMIMAHSKLDISFEIFINRLGEAIHLSSFLTGICKAPVFAAIIALVGCYQGFQVTGSADSVGRQTTISVVQSIFLVIFTDALFSITFNWLNI